VIVNAPGVEYRFRGAVGDALSGFGGRFEIVDLGIDVKVLRRCERSAEQQARDSGQTGHRFVEHGVGNELSREFERLEGLAI
jgi:hypothetical protein